MDDQRQNGRERAAGRARAVVSAWTQRTFVELKEEPYVRRTRRGEVTLTGLTGRTDGEGNAWVEVYAQGDVEAGDPHFRIVNPPTLVEDPQGPVELDGRRYREDPLAALAEVIGRHGGAVKPKRRRRTRG